MRIWWHIVHFVWVFLLWKSCFGICRGVGVAFGIEENVCEGEFASVIWDCGVWGQHKPTRNSKFSLGRDEGLPKYLLRLVKKYFCQNVYISKTKVKLFWTRYTYNVCTYLSISICHPKNLLLLLIWYSMEWGVTPVILYNSWDFAFGQIKKTNEWVFNYFICV